MVVIGTSNWDTGLESTITQRAMKNNNKGRDTKKKILAPKILQIN